MQEVFGSLTVTTTGQYETTIPFDVVGVIGAALPVAMESSRANGPNSWTFAVVAEPVTVTCTCDIDCGNKGEEWIPERRKNECLTLN